MRIKDLLFYYTLLFNTSWYHRAPSIEFALSRHQQNNMTFDDYIWILQFHSITFDNFGSRLEAEHEKMKELELLEILDQTGCKKPCRYQEYRKLCWRSWQWWHWCKPSEIYPINIFQGDWKDVFALEQCKWILSGQPQANPVNTQDNKFPQVHNCMILRHDIPRWIFGLPRQTPLSSARNSSFLSPLWCYKQTETPTYTDTKT